MDDSTLQPPAVADSSSQTERVISSLREMVLRGDFRPGERLAELTLVPRLHASRTPVRLALDRLAHEGLLEALPAGGFKIREFAIADIWDAIEVRGVLEGTAARLAAERLTGADDLSRLERCCRDMERLDATRPGDAARYFEIHDVFQAELSRLSKSDILIRTIESVVGLTFAVAVSSFLADVETPEGRHMGIIALEHHRAIVDAIEHRQGTRAEGLAREYSRMARRNLVRATQDKELFRRVPGASLIRMPAGQSSR
jgi:GntR family transcriptional regulator of vanillate catabolism